MLTWQYSVCQRPRYCTCEEVQVKGTVNSYFRNAPDVDLVKHDLVK